MAQYPDIAASEEFVVETLREMIPNYIFKTSATNRFNNTLSDDPDLVVPVEANAVYHIKFIVNAGAILAADLLTNWSVPAGASGLKRVLGPGSAATDTLADNVAMRCGVHGFTTPMTYSGVRNSNSLQFSIWEESLVTIGGTAGNVAFQWAQANTNATASIVHASWAEYRRVA